MIYFYFKSKDIALAEFSLSENSASLLQIFSTKRDKIK